MSALTREPYFYFQSGKAKMDFQKFAECVSNQGQGLKNVLGMAHQSIETIESRRCRGVGKSERKCSEIVSPERECHPKEENLISSQPFTSWEKNYATRMFFLRFHSRCGLLEISKSFALFSVFRSFKKYLRGQREYSCMIICPPREQQRIDMSYYREMWDSIASVSGGYFEIVETPHH